MKFLVVAFVLVGCAFAADPDPQQQARAMMANRILTADPASFTDCRHDPANGCTKPGWKCQSMMKLCAPGNSPKLEETEGPCQPDAADSHTQCKPLYRCNQANTCAFVGPKACTSPADCNANVKGAHFECKELPKNAPGHRCWLKCGNDLDCHGCKSDGSNCRVPENFRKQIGCCQGLCQRKSQCSA